MASLFMTEVGDAWYLVRLGAAEPVQWSRAQVEAFLGAHSYTPDDIEGMLLQAGAAHELEIHVPDEPRR
jgi:hypothetical protein